MDNFIFAEELELSIIEHRLKNLFRMLDELGEDIFYPAIIFNETFWQLNFKKRLSVLTEKQRDWAGIEPIKQTILYKDNFFIDLIKSIKITYFNYTKLTLETFIDIFKTKNKFTISDFIPFSEPNNSGLSLLNDILIEKNEKLPASQEKSLLNRINALKYYSASTDKTQIDTLIIAYEFNPQNISNFINSIIKIDKAQKTKIYKNSRFTIIFINKYSKQLFDKYIEENDIFKEIFESNNFEYDYIDADSLEIKDKYDFILLDNVLSSFPVEILTKFDGLFFNALYRLTYIDRYNPKKTLENISLITAPIRQLDKINDEIFDNIDFELTWKRFENTEIINLLEQACVISERINIRFSISILKLLVKLIKSLKQNGQIYIWDYCDNDFSKYGFGIFNDKRGLNKYLVDYKLYFQIMDLFEDISIETSITSSLELISSELHNNNYSYIKLKDIIRFVNDDKQNLQEFFDINNFDFLEDVKKITNKYKIFSKLKEQKIILFGLPTFLYNLGFGYFNKSVLKEKKLVKLLQKSYLKKYDVNSYEKEFFRNLLPMIVDKMTESDEVLVCKEIDDSKNADIKKVIEAVNMNLESFFQFVINNWDKIEKQSRNTDNYSLMNIIRK